MRMVNGHSELQLSSTIDPKEWHWVAGQINETIDFEESETQDRIVVKEGVCPRLDEHNELYQDLDRILVGQSKREHILSSWQSNVAKDLEFPKGQSWKSANVVYFPKLGYLVSFPLTEEEARSAINEREITGYEFQVSL